MDQLILSLFPGIDLLGMGFEMEGCCVVRGPDIILGQQIETFQPSSHRFDGIIGGSPCQDFSQARRSAPTGDGERLLGEFGRCVATARPAWFLLENVPAVPDIRIDGYEVQRCNLMAWEFGVRQRRLRTFQFGHSDGAAIVVPRTVTRPPASLPPAALATEAGRANRRTWPDFCELQGLPRTFSLPGWSQRARYRAVGNGVPIPVARALARAILTRWDTLGVTVCICGCARPIDGQRRAATASCRKRMERRRRDSSRSCHTGSVKPAV